MNRRLGTALLAVALLSGAAAAVVAAVLPTSAVLVLLTGLVAALLGATIVLVARVVPRLLDQSQESLELGEAVRRRSTRIDRRSRAMSRQLKSLATGTAATYVASTHTLRDPASPAADTITGLEVDGTAPSVVLFLHSFSPNGSFAGVRTAVAVAARLADRLDMPLRVLVVHVSGASHEESAAALRELVRIELGDGQVAEQMRLSTPDGRDLSGHHPDDVWVTTFWSTAHAVGTRVADGAIRAERVIYLVQDFEPAFHPWGHLYAKALSTYRLGFRLLVNSAPLAGFISDETGLDIDPRQVLAPALPTVPLGDAAARWKPGGPEQVRVLFYARPTKPRNMFVTGLQALEEWADSLPAHTHAVVRCAGESFKGRVDLGPRITVEKLGNLGYDEYYDLLADTDIGLALMLSPHPGHLALELPMAGIPTVTNQFVGRREPWVDGLIVADADVPSIARALAEAAGRAAGLTEHEPVELGSDLGVSTEAAVDFVAQSLRSRA